VSSFDLLAQATTGVRAIAQTSIRIGEQFCYMDLLRSGKVPKDLLKLVSSFQTCLGPMLGESLLADRTECSTKE
jgi:hypothetical protein